MWVQLGMNLRERERGRGEGRGERESEGGKGLWRSSVVFLALLLHRQHHRGEGRQLSTSFRFQQLSLGLHHAGRVCGELQEGDELVGVLLGSCLVGLSFFFWIWKPITTVYWLQVLGLLDVMAWFQIIRFYVFYIK
jgi:hypothetical protein